MGGVPDWLSELVPEVEDEDASVGAATAERGLFDDLLEPSAAATTPAKKSTAAVPSSRKRKKTSRRRKSSKRLGLYPWQQFVLSVFLFVNVAVVGMVLLLILERIYIP